LVLAVRRIRVKTQPLETLPLLVVVVVGGGQQPPTVVLVAPVVEPVLKMPIELVALPHKAIQAVAQVTAMPEEIIIIAFHPIQAVVGEAQVQLGLLARMRLAAMEGLDNYSLTSLLMVYLGTLVVAVAVAFIGLVHLLLEAVVQAVVVQRMLLLREDKLVQP
tara:strand:- start:100 stop:585 length:486 start_codon:yes stop_codon:yes gene_type:complete